MGFGAQTHGTSPFGSQGSGVNLAGFTLKAVEPLNSDLIRVHFNEAIVIDPAFTNPENYLVVQATTSEPLTVREVIPPKDGSLVTTKVLLNTYRIPENVRFSTSVINLVAKSGKEPNSSSIIVWTYQRTKVDSILKSIPDVYDKSPKSNIRAFLTAISLEDNRIGGFPAEGI